MRVLAPAKVNLCLFLGPVRADGKHELVTVFESVSLADELDVVVGGQPADEVVCTGLDGPNIVASALAGLRTSGWDAPPVRVRIRKRIPVAAGMGGGSADAAAMLRVAGEIAPVPESAVLQLAAELGADVPSQLSPGLALGTGAGERIESRRPLAPHAFLIVPANGGLSTADVYREADRLGLPREPDVLRARLDQLAAALTPGAQLPKELLVNDLQAAALSLCPEIGDALEAVRSAGADHALVCGSGPTVAGLYWGADGPERAARAAAAIGGRAITALPVSRPSRESGTISTG